MSEHFGISSTLDHDGDGLVRFKFWAGNADFSASIKTWGYSEEIQDLAAALEGFPKSALQKIDFVFGDAASGRCHLIFEATDSVGHCCVWVDIVAVDRSSATKREQRALLFVKFVPADLDRFRYQLLHFVQGNSNEAVLAERPL